MKNTNKKSKIKSGGILCGILNGMFGSGGGTAAVPVLESEGLSAQKSHATSVTVIFFISLISTFLYGLEGNLDYAAAIKYIPYGLAGAVIGSVWLKKVPNELLRKIFGAVMLFSAIRLLTK
jgi:uncharacterized membrane protein YfcA